MSQLQPSTGSVLSSWVDAPGSELVSLLFMGSPLFVLHLMFIST